MTLLCHVKKDGEMHVAGAQKQPKPLNSPLSVPAPLGCALSRDNAAHPSRRQLNFLLYSSRDSLFSFRKLLSRASIELQSTIEQHCGGSALDWSTWESLQCK